MKFKIRYADQIVGTLALAAVLAVIAVIFMLGSKQRWFARDYSFSTTFETATGISAGMPLLYKGFTIGKIRTIALNKDDRVDVTFAVYDTYYDRAREGSLVELIINPIGLGNQFLFHPGNGTALIREGSFIVRADTPEGQDIVTAGLCTIPKRDDTITNLIAQINPLLTNINDTLVQVNGAFRGTGKGPLAETLTGVAKSMTNVSGITTEVYGSIDTVMEDITALTANVKQITSNLETLSGKMTDPKGLVPTLIDPDGTMFASIDGSLKAVEGTLGNVEDSSAILKTQVPEIARLIEDLRIALVKGQDVLEALRNNPILKNGVPERIKTDSSGTNSRNIEF